jgi:type II secretory pathway pseudopilin PulG
MSAARHSISRRGARVRAGLSLFEALISLVISSVLLVAVASAYVASANAVELNDRFYRATQAARVSISQIMTEVRRCESVTVGATSLAMTTYSGESREYDYSAASSALTITRYIATPATVNTLAPNVKSCSFTTDGETVTMIITVTIGTDSLTLSGCATPRRAVTYH